MNSTHYKKEILVKDYFDIHSHYNTIYNSSDMSKCNILILMQVGSFHECYNTDTEGPNLHYIGEKLDMIVTMKNKNKPLSTSNPRMMGFPSYIVDDTIDRIISIGYTVVRIDQTTEPPNPKREVVGIFSSSTHINSTKGNNNNIVCITLDCLKLKTTNPILCIGLASYCMMTDEGCVYETVSTSHDNMLALDEALRFMEKYPPSEVVYYCSKNMTGYLTLNQYINRMTLNDIMKYIGINDNTTIYKINNNDMITNSSYQQNIIMKIFNDMMDHINLHALNMARLALVGILEFTTNHMPLLVEKLQQPKYFDQTNTLFLGNKAIEQLDILPMEGKTKTLFSSICMTRTPMGRRMLISSLNSPSIVPSVLNSRYNLIEQLLKNNRFESIYSNMNNITDLPKLVRKMELKKIYPFELVSFYNSMLQIKKTFSELDKEINITENMNKMIKNITNITTHIENTFDIEYIEKMNYINYKEESVNYIKNNKYPKIIELSDSILTGNNFMEHLVKQLEKLIEEKNSKVIRKDQTIITLKYNDRDGHYMLLTKRRSKILRENLAKIENIKIGSNVIKTSDLEFNDMPRCNNTKITCKDIMKISVDVVELKSQLAMELKEAFYNEITLLMGCYNDMIKCIIDTITMLDFMNSGARCAHINGYSKPKIVEKENAYFDAKQLRHPIVELINEDTSYHPYDISIGTGYNYGILLYGINSSGKSTLMKSIGLAIVMAQIGYYVPATEYTYSPYTGIFTRIVGTDNIFRGMSSFMIEMMELMAILKRNNNKTMVLGDEICRGTEEKSANIIVAYMLETLVSSKTSFITATHLHSIANLPSVRNLNGIRICHLKINYDEKNDMLVYQRELVEGQGDKYYGVMVAKYLMKSDHFNNRTKELEMEYEDYSVKKSNYNKDILMLSCTICNGTKKLETHHIHFQKDCDDVKVIRKPHIKKNKPYNLVILCSKCHDMIDRKEIVVNGWVQTSDNIKLDWYNSEPSQSTHI